MRTMPPTPPHTPAPAPSPDPHPGHLFREEGRLAHGGIGAGSDVKDAVTHLQHGKSQGPAGGHWLGWGPCCLNLTSKE